MTGKSYRDVWKEFPDGERKEFLDVDGLFFENTTSSLAAATSLNWL